MSLSEIKIFNCSPKEKPVIRINSYNKASVTSFGCPIGYEIANRYVNYHSFLSASAAYILLESNKKPT